MISFTANYNTFFIRCHSNTAAFAPDLKLGCCVFGFCRFHCSSPFHLVCPFAFENARQQRRCNRPDACNCPTGKSTPVFRLIRAGVFPLLRCGRERTKWAGDTSGSERRDTIACRLWAIEKYSTNLTSIRNAGYGLSQFRLVSGTNVTAALFRTSAHIRTLLGCIRPPRGKQSRNESERISITSIVLCPSDNNTNRRESF